MKLSQVVSSYRQEHGISMDKFAKMCGVSKSYISMLENEVNPQSGKCKRTKCQEVRLYQDPFHRDS